MQIHNHQAQSSTNKPNTSINPKQASCHTLHFEFLTSWPISVL